MPEGESSSDLRKEIQTLSKRINDCMVLMNQIQFHGMVVASALVEKGIITSDELSSAATRLTHSAAKLTAKLTELKSSGASIREKVFESVPYRIRAEDLQIPRPEFLRHVMDYLVSEKSRIGMAAMLDIVAFYGIPRSDYEPLLRDRGELLERG